MMPTVLPQRSVDSRPMRRLTLSLLAGLFLTTGGLSVFPVAEVEAAPPAIIPREVLLGNPERTSPKLSPDGKNLAWIAPDQKNVLQVWVQTLGKDDKRMVTADKKRGIRSYFWAEDSATLLYIQDLDGDENWHVYGAPLAGGRVRDYTPFQGVRADILDSNPALPKELLVELNLRNPQLMDVYRVNLETGALSLDTENPGDVSGWATDSKMVVRGAFASTPDGGSEIRVRDDEKAAWKVLVKAGPEETVFPVNFSQDGKSIRLVSSLNSDTAQLVEQELATGAQKLLASSSEVDVGGMLVNPKTHVIEAVSFAPGRNTWKVIDPAVKNDLAGLAKLFDGDFGVVSRDREDKTWLVAYTADNGPVRFYSWDRATQKGTFLFVHQPKLEGLMLAPMQAVVFPARDGLKLNGYLTLPTGLPPKNLPLVLFVHGGPWARDTWGFNPTAQLLANRGYAVLQVNFRASTGYGKKFLNAGNKQWGLTMQDDLLDAVNWAVKKGYADPKKVAIYGGSYGGYAALMGVTRDPDFFACAVDVVGPSNLNTLIKSFPPYWKTMRSRMDTRIGNIDDPKDAELLKAASPLFKADRIKKPLLIGQGANDPRVPQPESEQIVAAIEKNGGSVTYVLYPDEGHGFARPENRIDFMARTEAFLGACLGGRVEPMNGDKLPGATAVIRVVGK